MILIDNQKFACSACINGHRSSSCQHTDRPLFEIKKKGRPVTQCERCRELRKTRSYHSKCTCDKPIATSQKNSRDVFGASAEDDPGNKRKKASRSAPAVPTLPNGVRGLLGAKRSGDLEQKEQSRKRLKPMLNSCKRGCDKAKPCRCDSGDLQGVIQKQAEGGNSHVSASNLAQPQRRATPSQRLLPKPKKSVSTPVSVRSAPANSCCAPHAPQSESSLHHGDAPIVIKPLSPPQGSAGPSLFPSIATWSTPEMIPTLHKHTTTSMDSCGCGDGCACAGCVEHRGAVAAAAAIAAGHHSCPDRCETCQDMSSVGMQMSSLTGPSIADDNSIESLLARAIAKLPPPPPGKLSVFQSESGGERVALVVLPRLDKSGGIGEPPRTCCTPSAAATPTTSSGNESIAPLTPPALESLEPGWSRKSSRYRRQIRSPSPSDDGLTDADAEGELDPDSEPQVPDLPQMIAVTKSWAYAQLDIDVDFELGLAADAIDKQR